MLYYKVYNSKETMSGLKRRRSTWTRTGAELLSKVVSRIVCLLGQQKVVRYVGTILKIESNYKQETMSMLKGRRITWIRSCAELLSKVVSRIVCLLGQQKVVRYVGTILKIESNYKQ